MCNTVFGKHCDCIAQKCTNLGRLPPLVSHSLLLRHCVLTWYGGKKKKLLRKCASPGFESKSIRTQAKFLPPALREHLNSMGRTVSTQRTPINLNFKPHFFVKNGKIQLMPKIMNHLFMYYLNCVGKSNPVCLIQQIPLVILVAFYVQ